MKIALLAATAVAAFSVAGAATAQDFAGFYVGAQVGYAWGDADMPYGAVGGPFVSTQDDAPIDGAVLGGRAGFNWQSGSLVLGVEGDIEWTDQSGDDGGSGGDVNGVDINSQYSLRGRLGWAFAPETMLYGTAGWTWQDVDASAPAGDVNETIDGMVYGVGLEHRFDASWTATVEYRHTDMDQERFSFPADGYDEGISTDSDSVRVGVNFSIHP